MSADSVVEPLRPGDPQQLGTYVLLGRIGRGGMGTVFLAQSATGDRTAVKVINPDLAHDPAFRDRFRREVEAARRVRRFCTAPVLDAQLEGEPLYIVTEYVNGPDLHEYVRTSGPMRGSNLDLLAVGVATALTAIHGAGVVHRDLKPANVLLSALGPRVIDFGIARALDTVAETRTGNFIGTPAYMAPEVIEGAHATPASDIFAWGAVVAFAGTGISPFRGDTVPAVLYRITHGEPQTDGLDDEVRQLVEHAMAKDPALRPSAQELLDGLVGQEHVDFARTADAVRHTWRTPPSAQRNVTISESAYFPRADAAAPDAARTDGGRTDAVRTDGAARTDSATLLAPPPDLSTLHGPPVDLGRRRRPSRRTLALAGVGTAAVVALALAGALMFSRTLSESDGPPEKVRTLFSDDFSDPNTAWPGGPYQGGFGYLNGRYRLETTGNDPDESSPAPFEESLPPRALVSADVTVISGPPYGAVGLWCFGPDSSVVDGYVFLVRLDGDGTAIRKLSGRAISKQLIQTPDAKGYLPKGRNRVQIACEQQQDNTVRLRLWLNGHLATEYLDADDPLSQGQAGAIVRREGGGSGGQVVADFDNFDISRIY
ncbi:MAG: serine/threonine-protein kinase [Actinomadura sp.]